jgi:hypothetical protein
MRLYLLLSALVLLFFWSIPSAYACQIMYQPETMNLTEIATNASTILVGEVANIFYEPDDMFYGDNITIEVEVEQYLKGEGLALVEIYIFCATHAELDQRYIFFLNPDSSGTYFIAYASDPYNYEPTTPATADNIAAVQAITGQSTAPQPLPFSNQLMRFVSKNSLFLAESSLSLVALAGVFWFIKRKAVRKPKLKREEML